MIGNVLWLMCMTWSDREQKRLSELNKLLTTIIDSIPMELSIKDPDDHFRLRLWNKEAGKNTGISAATSYW